jgi:preprotein translocase subunit SecY
MNWRTTFKAFKNKDMQKRLLILLLLIVSYRLLAHIPIPLAQPTELKQLISSVLQNQQLLGFLNLLSGGALASLSIMLVGLTPYINASIIMQLLTKAIPQMEELNKEGEVGRRKIQQWTRLIALPLAVLQSIGFIFILRQTTVSANLGIDITANVSPIQWILMVGAMTTGAMLLMWLGELITEQGLGNGISLLVFAGVVSQLPNTVGTLSQALTHGNKLHLFHWTLPFDGEALGIIAGLGVLALISTYLVVKLNEAQRIITVNYAKRVQGNRTYGGVQGILPIKLITAGVIPVIFAVAFLSLPSFIGQLLTSIHSKPWMMEWGTKLVTWFQTPTSQSFASPSLQTLIYPGLYFLLVVIFTYFYTNIAFNAKEAAENLQKQGGFVSDIRPGKQTEKYLTGTVNRLMLFGSFALGFIAILPFATEFVLAYFFKLNTSQQLSIGGTGLLIVVSVTIETLRLIQSRALMVMYDEEY